MVLSDKEREVVKMKKNYKIYVAKQYPHYDISTKELTESEADILEFELNLQLMNGIIEDFLIEKLK